MNRNTSPNIAKRKRVMKRTVLLFMTLLVIFSSCFYNDKRMSLPAMCTGRIRLRRLLCTLCFIVLTFTGSNDHPFTSFLISLPFQYTVCCRCLSSLIQIIFENGNVDHATKQNHVHTEVQPEHDKDNGRQTPVHSGKSLKNVQIDR